MLVVASGSVSAQLFKKNNKVVEAQYQAGAVPVVNGKVTFEEFISAEGMSAAEIEEKVKAFLIDELEIDEEKIFPEAKLKADMGIDSLDFVDIVVIVEKNFGFKIKAEEMVGVDTFSKFCDYIETKVG